jgi:hypothetical protein
MEDPDVLWAQDLADLGRAESVRFQLKDERGRGLDCLKLVPSGRAYLGLHHTLQNGAFELCLVESNDLVSFRPVATLDRHAHQGTLRACGDGWLAAWEKDGPNGNWTRVVYYPSDAALRSGMPAKQIDLPRTLSPAAEGTPHFRSVPRDPLTGTIEIGFHYYRNADVDRQAYGTLTAFQDWRPRIAPEVDASLESFFGGNIGDRDEVRIEGRDFLFLETQLRKNDWTSWRVHLRVDRGDFRAIPFRTPGWSTSFANPSATMLNLPGGRPGLALSLFLPSQGNAPREAGQMLALYDLARLRLGPAGPTDRRAP